MRKLLYILSILCTVSAFSIVDVDAMSLKDALQSKDISLDFNSSGSICYNNNDSGTTGSINTEGYSFENNTNTYFLLPTTLEELTNTGGGITIIIL